VAYAAQGRLAEASTEYHAAIKLKPASPQLRERLSEILERQGNNSEAMSQIRIALHFMPKTDTRLRLAGLLYEASDFPESVGQYRSVLALDPDDTTALNNLAFILVNCPDHAIRNGPGAIELAEHACRLTDYRQPSFITTLSAAYREAGRISEASAAADLASRMQLALSEGEAWPQRPMAKSF